MMQHPQPGGRSGEGFQRDRRYRIAVHTMLFYAQDTVLQMIANCGPFVDKIYVAYSETPWSYNQKARDQFKSTLDLSVLEQSEYADKIEIIQGVWDTDEDERNTCLEHARADGMDFLIIQDADEFYTSAQYARMIGYMTQNPDWDFYLAERCTFWKDWHHVLVQNDGSVMWDGTPIAINCRNNVNFQYSRVPGSKRGLVLDVWFCHGAFVLSDDDMYKKIHTWAHTGQIPMGRDEWFREKWLNWTPDTQDLDPLGRGIFKQAVPYTGELPEVLR